MREVREERGAGETDETAMSAEETQRADGIRRLRAEPAAPLAGQRLRKDEQPVEEVREREDGRRPEWRAQVDAREEAAERRPDDESDAERDASMPNRAARFSGGVTSATYAPAVLNDDDVMPEIRRPTKRIGIVGASAMTT